MKKVVVLLLLASSLLSAANSIESSIVKTFSKRCSGGTTYKGSGTLFWKNGKAYVLTSDHVILHSNKGFCHSVYLPLEKKEIKARFLASEWGNGLALLSIEESIEKNQGLDFSELAPKEIINHEGTISYGFPLGTQELTIDDKGVISNLEELKPFYVLQRTMTHVTGTSVEFGMSGGGGFTKDRRFVGVLSHQLLSNRTVSNELFLVPAKSAFQWLTLYFDNPQFFKIFFFEHAEGQLMGDPMILTKNFVLMFRNVDSGISVFFRHIPEGTEAHEGLFEKEFPLVLYEDPNHYMSRITDYVSKQTHNMEEAAVSIRLFKTINGEEKILPMEYLASWFQALDKTDFKVKTRVAMFHSDRAEPLMAWTQEYDRRVYDATKSLSSTAQYYQEFKSALSDFSKILNSVPKYPIVPPGSLVAQDFFTFEWLWLRKNELKKILKSENYTHLWSEMEKQDICKKRDLEKMLQSIESTLAVDEI